MNMNKCKCSVSEHENICDQVNRSEHEQSALCSVFVLSGSSQMQNLFY